VFSPSVVKQMPGQNLQRRGTTRTLPNFCVVLCIECFVTFSVLFLCICVLNYCHRVATQLQLNKKIYITNKQTNSVQQNSFSCRSWAGQKIANLLRNQKVNYRTHNSPATGPFPRPKPDHSYPLSRTNRNTIYT
jgi:hypothetical protein